MDSQIFRNFVGEVHKRWLSEVLGVPSQGNGIDLEGDRIGIELKSKLKQKNYPCHFAVAEYQIDWNNDEKEYYWAFMGYWLSKKVRDIERNDSLEDLVTRREVYVKPWDFVNNFPVADVRTGPFVYVKLTEEDKTDNVMEVERGTLYLPKDFDI